MESRFKEYLRRNLSNNNFKLVKNFILKIASLPYSNNLNMLALIYQSDKYGAHYYTQHYQKHFRKYKFRRVVLLEIGAGGYVRPDQGGQSLRMWKRYFPYGRIFSIDIYDKSFLEESRIKIFRCDQTDESGLNKIIDQTGPPDIIIDDGSHINQDVIKTFQILFPKLKTGGIYAIEDTQTSYWPDFGGDSTNLGNPSTIMNYFKRLTDCLNHQEYAKKDQASSYFDQNIVSVEFYHNLIFINKGLNDEKSMPACPYEMLYT